MITNFRAVVLAVVGAGVAGPACSSRAAEDSRAGQGIVEYEQRVLGFELGGRVTELSVIRGDRVRKGQRLATPGRRARTHDAHGRAPTRNEAARAQLGLLQAGARPEDIRSVAARVKAARTSEAQAKRNLERERELNRRGVTRTGNGRRSSKASSSARRPSGSRSSKRCRSMRSGARHPELEAAEAKADAAKAVVKLEERAAGAPRAPRGRRRRGARRARRARRDRRRRARRWSRWPTRGHRTRTCSSRRRRSAGFAWELAAADQGRRAAGAASGAGREHRAAHRVHAALPVQRARAPEPGGARARAHRRPGERLHAGVPAFVQIEERP